MIDRQEEHSHRARDSDTNMRGLRKHVMPVRRVQGSSYKMEYERFSSEVCIS